MYIQKLTFDKWEHVHTSFCKNLEQQLKDTNLKLEYKNIGIGKTFLIVDNENQKKVDFFVRFLKKTNINLKFKEKNLLNFKYTNYQFYTPKKLDGLLYQEDISCSFNIVFWNTIHWENIKLYQCWKEFFRTEWRIVILNDEIIDKQYSLQHNNLILTLSECFILTQYSKDQYNIYAFRKENNWIVNVFQQRVALKNIVCFFPSCLIFKDENNNHQLFLNNGLLIKLPNFDWGELLDISTLLQNNYLSLTFRNERKLGHIQNWELIFQEEATKQQQTLRNWVFNSGKEIKPKLSFLKYDIPSILRNKDYQEAIKDNKIIKEIIEHYKSKQTSPNGNDNRQINIFNKMRNNFYGYTNYTGFLIKEEKWQLKLLDGIFMQITICKNNNWFCKYCVDKKEKYHIDLVNINNDWEIIEQYALLECDDLTDVPLSNNPFVFVHKTRFWFIIHSFPNEQNSKTFLLKNNIVEEIPTNFKTKGIIIIQNRFFSFSKNTNLKGWNVFNPHLKKWVKTYIDNIYAPKNFWTDWRCKAVNNNTLIYSKPPKRNEIFYPELAKLNIYEEADYSFMQEILYIERSIRHNSIAKYKKSLLTAKERKHLSTNKILWVLDTNSLNFKSPKCIRAYDIYKKEDCVLGSMNKYFFNLRGKKIQPKKEKQ